MSRIPDDLAIRYGAILDEYEGALKTLNSSKSSTLEDLRADLRKLGMVGAEISAEIAMLKGAVKLSRMTETERQKSDEKDDGVADYVNILALARARAHVRGDEHDAETGEVIEQNPEAKASEDNAITDEGRALDTDGAGDASRLSDGSGSVAPIRRMSMTPLEPREAGGLKGFGFTVRFDEPEAAMLPQTAGSETAVANSTPGSGAGTVDAGEANWPSEMTTASPANEPETIPPVADPATVVSEAANGDSAPSLAAIPVADQSKPNPICRDPGDCGVYASWAMPCEACKAAAAHRSAA